MTATNLKLLACFLMLVDHIGYVLFPDVVVLRLVGRFSFPIFAWLLVEGFRHTHDLPLYGLRLLGLGIVSQPIYYRITQSFNLNILFTLALGLLLLRLAEINNYGKTLIYLFVILSLAISDSIPLEYGSYGLTLILLIALELPLELNLICWFILHLLAARIVWPLQFFAFFTVFLLMMSKGESGTKLPKYLFYGFYPIHLGCLYFLKQQILGS
ncbi:MAG: TraX family protein [Jaaginema sp. PMC 1079.18]|nr:TraX family protein [Jaaginema sp. PMC 1080.18]MEC4849823.1 TraX family protein [Jaaginema sp. PMC 1079.18]MEC4865267.1 TraX family protein [Jaaginema sp. PMC 1078.18]